jgi:hypothetical protein
MILLSTTQTKENEMYDALKAQLEKTTKNLERGEVQLADRIFLNHILDELDFILTNDIQEDGIHLTGQMYTIAESTLQMLGSTNELVEDGLDD